MAHHPHTHDEHENASAVSRKTFERLRAKLDRERKKRLGKPLRLVGISCSTVNTDDKVIREPSSERLLAQAFEYAKKTYGAETRMIRLRDLTFRHCEANYSIKSEYCTWPCWLQQRYPDDGMGIVYDSLVDWCDGLILATPIRWGNAGSLYYQMAQRLNCLENQHALYGKDLIGEKPAGFIISGGQDGVQHVAGELFSFWSQMGFSFGKRAFVGFTTGGWLNEEMEKNQKVFEKYHEELSVGVRDLVDGLVRQKRGYDAVLKAGNRKK